MVTQREQSNQHNNETFHAMTAAYKLINRRISEVVSEEGLTQPQFQALRIVAKSGGTSMREISAQLLVTPANVTGIIDRLESRGLMTRGAHRKDRRTTIIELTPAGNALQQRVATKYSEFMRKALQVLSRDEQAALRDLLTKLQEGMSRPDN